MDETGEQLFEQFAASLGLAFERIAEAASDGEQRPDYRATGTDGSVFIAEVKVVTPSVDEARDIARVMRGEIFASGLTPGGRLRRFIGKANQQMKALGEAQPGVLVVFNPNPFLRRHTEPYSILTAMRGLDTIDVTVPTDSNVQPVFGELRSGPGQKMTADHNRSTSAIVCPEEVARGVWRVGVYHNRFAVRPLATSVIRGQHVTHFDIAADERDWVVRPAI
jgi:hypothetical protein